MSSTISKSLLAAARELSAGVDGLRFAPPVTQVYNPLDYAWAAHEAYLTRYGATRKRVLFLGMNPGPFGMAQTGVPFGEIDAVRNWLGIELPVGRPRREHPMRPVMGFLCPRSEVSGRRLWGFFAKRFGTAEAFFAEHFVINYCPLAFFEDSGRNRTPDKLPAAEAAPLTAACDRHLARLIEIFQPEWIIGVGRFALECASRVAHPHPVPGAPVSDPAWMKPSPKRAGSEIGAPPTPTDSRTVPGRAPKRVADEKSPVKLGTILHPSPASPAANRDWEGTALKQLRALGVWS